MLAQRDVAWIFSLLFRNRRWLIRRDRETEMRVSNRMQGRVDRPVDERRLLSIVDLGNVGSLDFLTPTHIKGTLTAVH